MKFKVAIIRTETQSFIVEAENSTEVVDILSDEWDNDTIELDNPDTSILTSHPSEALMITLGLCYE